MTLYRIKSIKDEVLNIFLNKYTLCKYCLNWLINEFGWFFLFDLATSTKIIFIHVGIFGQQQLYNKYRYHNLLNSNW